MTTDTPKEYRDIGSPYATADACNKAMAEFCEAVKSLRAEYGIPDLYLVFQVAYHTKQEAA